MMTAIEQEILRRFKELVAGRLPLSRMVVFGSRARGDAGPDSDMDVLVVLEGEAGENEMHTVSECAWEACFGRGILLAPVTVSRCEWEQGPERHSSLAKEVQVEGIPLA